MCAADAAERATATPSSSASPRAPPWASKRRGCQVAGARAARAEPERAGGEREHQRGEQAERRRRGTGRTAGSTGRRTRTAPGGDERDRARRRRPRRRASASPSTSAARRAAVPAEVEREGQEDAGGDEAEADQVEWRCSSTGSAPAPGRRGARGAALRALLARPLAARGASCVAGIGASAFGLGRFDARARVTLPSAAVQLSALPSAAHERLA